MEVDKQKQVNILLKVIGCPKNWINVPPENILPSKQKEVQTVVDYINKQENPLMLAVSGNFGYIIESIEKDILVKTNFINFSEVYDLSFSKAKYDTSYLKLKHLNIVYNIGAEEALKTSWSSKLLNNLVARARAAGQSLILVSDVLSPDKIISTYGLDLVNTVALPKTQDIKLF